MPEPQTSRILSIDTSSPRGSIALSTGRETVAEVRCVAPEHSGRLLVSIRSILRITGWNLEELHLVAVGIGPGSFTGIRIGVSVAIGLSQSLSIPLAAVSGLDALAQEVDPVASRVGIVLDAHRNQVYYAEYRAEPGRVKRVCEPGLWHPADLSRALGRSRIDLAGDGAVRYADALHITACGRRRLVRNAHFLAPGIGRLAYLNPASWITGSYVSVEPLYIRPPDALRKRATRD